MARRPVACEVLDCVPSLKGPPQNDHVVATARQRFNHNKHFMPITLQSTFAHQRIRISVWLHRPEITHISIMADPDAALLSSSGDSRDGADEDPTSNNAAMGAEVWLRIGITASADHAR